MEDGRVYLCLLTYEIDINEMIPGSEPEFRVPETPQPGVTHGREAFVRRPVA